MALLKRAQWKAIAEMQNDTFKTVCYEIQNLNPGCVVYLDTGGRALGHALGTHLQIPVYVLDIRYPMSRVMSRFPLLAPLFWLFKEIFYRCTHPRLKEPVELPTQLPFPVVLADDRIGSFRTVNAALNVITRKGGDANQVIVVAEHAGRRVQNRVNYVVGAMGTTL